MTLTIFIILIIATVAAIVLLSIYVIKHVRTKWEIERLQDKSSKQAMHLYAKSSWQMKQVEIASCFTASLILATLLTYFLYIM